MGYRRIGNITDSVLAMYRDEFGPQVSKDDIFYYVYAAQYRTTFRR